MEVTWPGASLTNDILIKILSKFGVHWFKMCSTDHNEILYMSQH